MDFVRFSYELLVWKCYRHPREVSTDINTNRDETGKLVINRTQEPIVVRLYQEFLDGKTTDYIKRIFEREGVKNWDGGMKC